MVPRWREPGAALLGLVETLHLAAAKMLETRLTVTYDDRSFNPAALGPHAALQQALAAARNQYGPAFTFRLGSSSTNVFVDQQGAVAGLEKKIYGLEYLEIHLQIDKEKLLTHWNLGDPACNAALFLAAEPLLHRIQQPLPDLDHGEEALFGDDRKLIVFVPARNLRLEGDYLAIVGGDALEQWQNRGTCDPAAAQGVNALARQKLNWMSGPLERITPLHLNVAGTAPPGDDIAEALHAQLLTCCLLYIANRSKFSAAGLESTFDSETSAVKMLIGDAAAVGELLRGTNAAEVIAEKTVRIYRDLSEAPDRLTVAQNAIASELEDSDPAAATARLIHRAGHIGKRIDYAWEAFIKGKLHTYFGQVKQLIETIQAAAKSYNEQVQTLTKTLIDNMLAAVAVIVGSFIAAMLKSPFEKYVFWFGIGTYVLYLLVFPLVVGLYSTLQRFRQTRDDFQRNIVQFSRGLPEKEVEEIVGTAVSEREWWFTGWWGITAGLYLAVVLVVVLIAMVVPDRIRRWSDAFELKSVAYGSLSGGAVPVTVRGVSFAEDKPIVVRVGNAAYTNTGGSLAVRGTTALTFAAPAGELRKNKYLTVQQGAAGPAKLALPACP
jgi:membrane protein YdbS with pleckstrin-like domain